ncbi:phosphate acyltransferase PlsX [Rickettsiales bacterium LUAb2]
MNSNSVTIAVDVMGGDNYPEAALLGINIFLKTNKNVKFLLFGDENLIQKYLKSYPLLNEFCEVIHVEEKIGDNWKVVEALRNGKNTSMWQAISAVAENKAGAVVSAGNTGALMAISKMVLKMLPKIDRPAIINYLPTKKNPFVILDLGANATCTPENLLQFAVMGDAFSKVVVDVKEPRISILNIGSEEMKGNSTVQEAAKLMTDHKKLNYVGFVEGDQLFDGNIDVVVTDGFSGNIALKVAEGTSKFLAWWLKKPLKKSILAKIGFLFLIPSLLKIRHSIDPRKYNGAMLIGLNGISVKAHGGSDKIAFASAIDATYKLIKGKVNKKIEEELNVE